MREVCIESYQSIDIGHLTNPDGLWDDILPEAEPRIITKRKRELGAM